MSIISKSFINRKNEKHDANKQRTNLLLLVDNELKTKNSPTKINSLTQKEFFEKNNEYFFIELNEVFSKNSEINSNFFKKSEKTKNSLNKKLEQKVSSSQNVTLSSESNLSNISVKSSTSSNNFTFLDSQLFSKSFSCYSPLVRKINSFEKNMNFLKTTKEIKEELIFQSYKKLKNMSIRIRNSQSKTTKNFFISKSSIDFKENQIKHKKKNFEINLKSMSTLEDTKTEEIIFYASRNLDISFEEI